MPTIELQIEFAESCEQKKKHKGLVHATQRDGPQEQVVLLKVFETPQAFVMGPPTIQPK